MSTQRVGVTIMLSFNNDVSISDRLKALGFLHRKTAATATTQQREVFHAGTGDVLGLMDVFDAVEFLRTQGAA